MGKLFDLAVEVSKGEIAGTLVHAESADQWQRLMGVMELAVA